MRILSDLSMGGNFSSNPSFISHNQLSIDALEVGFLNQATDVRFLAAMTAASGAFSLGRVLGTSLFSNVLGGAGLRGVSWSVGLLSEVATFRRVSQVLNPEAENWSDPRSFMATSSDFLLLKGAGALMGASSFGVRQAVQATAMVAGEYVGESLGLRQAIHRDFSARYANALVMGLAMEAGGHLTRLSTGRRLEALQRNLEWQTQGATASIQGLARLSLEENILPNMSAVLKESPRLGREVPAARALADSSNLPTLREAFIRERVRRGELRNKVRDCAWALFMAPLGVPILAGLGGRSYSIWEQARNQERERTEQRIGRVNNLLIAMAYLGDFSGRAWLEKTLRNTRDCAEALGLIPALGFQGDPSSAGQLTLEVLRKFFRGDYRFYKTGPQAYDPPYDLRVFPQALLALGDVASLDQMKLEVQTMGSEILSLPDKNHVKILSGYLNVLKSILNNEF